MREIKYKGKYIELTEEQIAGRVYERVSLRKGVQVIPYRDSKILLQKEKRRVEGGRARWKLISGWVDKENRSTLDHAKDEFLEEMGLVADGWLEYHISDSSIFTVNPAHYFYICENISKSNFNVINPDLGCEILDSRWFGFNDILEKMSLGEIICDNTISVALKFLYEKNKS